MFISKVFSGTSYFLLASSFLISGLFSSAFAQPFPPPIPVANESSEMVNSAGSFPVDFCQIGDITYFSAVGRPAFRELWRTDGTAMGTYMIKDINPITVDGLNPSQLSPSSNPRSFVNLNGTLYFTADNDMGRELWKSDGTTQGTTPVADIYQRVVQDDGITLDSDSANRNELFVFQGHLYFNGRQYLNGEITSLLYKSDGTSLGTDYVKDNLDQPLISGILEIASFDNHLYVSTEDALWVTGGSASGFIKLPLPTGKIEPRELTKVNNIVFFSVFEESLNVHALKGRELWKTDGTPGGTVKVKDIVPGETAGTFVYNLCSFKGKLYFTASDLTDGPELWVSDGTEAGTHIFLNINSGSSTTGFGSFPSNLTVLGDYLWFSADENVSSTNGNAHFANPKRDPWITDGTPEGTHRVIDLENSGPDLNWTKSPKGFVDLNGTTYFIAYLNPPPGSDVPACTVFRSDGSSEGTSRLADDYVFTSYLQQGSPVELAQIFARPDMLLLNGGRIPETVSSQGADLSGENELWMSDGTDVGTVLIKDINQYPASRVVHNIFTVNGRAYFTQPAINPASYYDIIRVDGTTLHPLTMPGSIQRVWHTDTHIYVVTMVESETETLYNLAVSDGESEFENILQLEDLFSLGSFIPWGSRALFVLSNDTDEVWVTDGTSEATTVVLQQEAESNYIPQICVISPTMALVENKPSGAAAELWSTDGTLGGSKRLHVPFSNSSADFSRIVPVNGKGVFFANADFGGTPVAGAGNFYLAESDGSIEGTRSVIDGALFVESQWLPNILAQVGLGNKMCFTYPSDESLASTGLELWVYDQGQSTINLLKDINPGLPGSGVNKESAVEFNGFLFFAANDGVHGRELWRTDGTESGTVMVSDIFPGLESSDPSQLSAEHGYLFFGANDPVAGYELFVLDGPNGEPQLVADINPGNSPSLPGLLTASETPPQLYFTASHNDIGSELWTFYIEPYTNAHFWQEFF